MKAQGLVEQCVVRTKPVILEGKTYSEFVDPNDPVIICKCDSTNGNIVVRTTKGINITLPSEFNDGNWSRLSWRDVDAAHMFSKVLIPKPREDNMYDGLLLHECINIIKLYGNTVVAYSADDQPHNTIKITNTIDIRGCSGVNIEFCSDAPIITFKNSLKFTLAVDTMLNHGINRISNLNVLDYVMQGDISLDRTPLVGFDGCNEVLKAVCEQDDVDTFVVCLTDSALMFNAKICRVDRLMRIRYGLIDYVDKINPDLINYIIPISDEEQEYLICRLISEDDKEIFVESLNLE